MKRCPECQFLYENDSLKCDMDGTSLRYTVALPSLPGLAKSIWDEWTISLLVAVIGGTVLITMYRATPRAYTSSFPTQAQEAASREMRPVKQNAQPAESATSSDSSSTQDALETSDPGSAEDAGRDPFESQSTTATKGERSKRPSPLTDGKQTSPAQVIHFEPPAAPGTSSTASKPST